MPLCKWFEMRETGKLWGVMSGDALNKKASPHYVIIPIDQVDELSPQEALNSIIELIPEAEFCGIEEWLSLGFEYCKRAPISYLKNIIETWKKFKGKETSVDETCIKLEEVLKRRYAKIEREKTKKKPSPGFVYLAKCQNYYKIGKSKNPEQRIAEIQTCSPFAIRLIHILPAKNMDRLESNLHKKFDHLRIKGEWFELDDQDVGYIKGLSR
jgi:hypothetical protein